MALCRLPYILALSVGNTRSTLAPGNANAARVPRFCLVNPLETQHPQFLLGAGHAGTLCLVCTEFPDSQKENRFSIHHIVFKQCAHKTTLMNWNFAGRAVLFPHLLLYSIIHIKLDS